MHDFVFFFLAKVGILLFIKEENEYDHQWNRINATEITTKFQLSSFSVSTIVNSGLRRHLSIFSHKIVQHNRIKGTFHYTPFIFELGFAVQQQQHFRNIQWVSGFVCIQCMFVCALLYSSWTNLSTFTIHITKSECKAYSCSKTGCRFNNTQKRRAFCMKSVKRHSKDAIHLL